MIHRVLFQIRLAKGLRWRRPHWLPTTHDVAMWLVTALAGVVIYLAVSKVVIEEARAEAVTAQERAEMESHTLLGAELLRQAGLPPVAHQIALYHHERWDGGGYPRGLSGEGIPLSARVIAAVDVYDAMRSHRPYRPDIPKDEVRRRVAELRGSHLDPRVVDALLRMDDVTENIFAEHGDPSAEPDPEVWR